MLHVHSCKHWYLIKQKTSTSDMAPYAVSQCPHWVYYWPWLLQLYFTVVWLNTTCTPAYWCLYYQRLFILRTHNLWYYQHWAVLWLWPQAAYSISHRTSECLKSLLSEGNTQYGLGALHRGNYTTDITRFSLGQRIAFLVGQVQCLKIHLSLEGNRPRTNTNTVPGECNTMTDLVHM